MLSAEQRTLRSKIAIRTRHGEEVDDLQREFKTLKLADHIREVVDSAPPLTQEQRDRLATLLRGGQ